MMGVVPEDDMFIARVRRPWWTRDRLVLVDVPERNLLGYW